MEYRIVKVGGSGVHGTIEFGNFYDKVGLPYEIWKIIEFHISCKIISEEFPEKLCLLRLITFLQRQEGGVIAARLENSLLPDLTVRIHLAKSENFELPPK